MDELTLGADFPAVTEQEWRVLVDRVLTRGGARGDAATRFERLVTTTEDGLRIEPLYTATIPAPPSDPGLPGLAPYTRGRTPLGSRARGWDVRQRVVAGDDAEATAMQVRDELERGATSIVLDVRTKPLLDGALDGVQLELMTLVLDSGLEWATAADTLAALWASSGLAPDAVAAVLGADPVGEWAASGGGVDLDALTEDTVRWARVASDQHPHVITVAVDASRVHEAGGGEVDELAYALALGVHYLRMLTDSGLDVDAAARQLEFRFAAAPDQFLTTAKLRAARRTWHRVASVCGVADTRQRQHAVTSRAATARYDTWVNVLRNTVACFAAGIGGADAVTVRPHDELIVAEGTPTGRRLARNTQLVLIEESNLARVVDPAGGAWYVEHLTDQLARAAWARFQDLERAGGVVEALRAGLVQEHVARVRDARADAVAHRRHPLTGVTEFPNIDEEPPPAVPPDEKVDGAALDPLRATRYAEPFEQQRGRADRIAERTGRRPEVCLVALGPPAVHTARTSFAKNLFEAGGIRALTTDGASDATAAAAAFRASVAPLACICSSDRFYADVAVDAAAAVAAAGPRRLYLAGRPEGLADSLHAAGVDELITAGGDALSTITAALDALEA